MENFVGPYKANPATIDLGYKVQLVCVHVVVITKALERWNSKNVMTLN